LLEPSDVMLEAGRKEFLSRILFGVGLAVPEPHRMQIMFECPLYHPEALSHGPVEFVVATKPQQPSEPQKFMVIVEAKRGELLQEIAQNLLELQCARLIQNGGTAYGAVTDAQKWLFLKHDKPHSFYLSDKEYAIDMTTSDQCKKTIKPVCDVLYAIFTLFLLQM